MNIKTIYICIAILMMAISAHAQDVETIFDEDTVAVDSALMDSTAHDSIAATTYANILAIREGDEQRPELKALAEVLKSDEIKKFIAEHSTGSTKRKCFNAVLCISLFKMYKLWPESYRKLNNRYTISLRYNKMSKLVYNNDNTKYKNSQNYIKNQLLPPAFYYFCYIILSR